ncbi:hypothetical protein ILYODFUR_028967 [Ilyodon furcidens]|uniref:Uncharacterized protein n=1 Tax=Ilyodon furcidens TaxID=33524 RepID=A0ABV0UJW9_9TELE
MDNPDDFRRKVLCSNNKKIELFGLCDKKRSLQQLTNMVVVASCCCCCFGLSGWALHKVDAMHTNVDFLQILHPKPRDKCLNLDTKSVFNQDKCHKQSTKQVWGWIKQVDIELLKWPS